MCSLSWRQFNDHIAIAFNRDELISRPKAELPRLFNDDGTQFIMPRDPQGEGSWLAVNEFGLAVTLLNDYQGKLKPNSAALRSRGLLVRTLASCRNYQDVMATLNNLELAQSQPFQLGLFFAAPFDKPTNLKPQLLHYDGMTNHLQQSNLPSQLFSSGHPEAASIIQQRTRLMQQAQIKDARALADLHRNHHFGDNRTYSLCMHRDDACTQSLTLMCLHHDRVEMKYWHGQPCETDHVVNLALQFQ